MYYNLYIASCDKEGGIYHYRMDKDNGDVSLKGFVSLDRPTYMYVSEDRLYALMKAPFCNTKESGLITYDIRSDGSLANPSDVISTHGEAACHLTLVGEDVYCVNYLSGNVVKMPDTVVKHEGVGINLPRQASAHTHFVCLTPDDKYLCVTDLGLDKIFIYDKNLNYISDASVPAGHGVRHIVFSDCGRYCFSANELKSTASAFEYSDGHLRYIDTQACLPDDFTGESTAAAIRYYNGKIYVSNRGHNSVSILDFNENKLELLKTHSVFGKSPRDFIIVGDYIISTNEESDNVSLIDCESGRLVKSIENIKSPLAAVVTTEA